MSVKIIPRVVALAFASFCIISCDYLVPILPEEDYQEAIKDEDFTISLTCDKNKYHYIGEFLYVTVEFSRSVDVANKVEREHFTCNDGWIREITEVDNRSCIIEVSTTGENLELFVSSGQIKNTNGNSNKNPSNTYSPPYSSLVHGDIIEICYGDSDRYIYALDDENQALHEIDVYTEEITREIALGYSSPVDMVYSEIDNKIYILYTYESNIEIVDLDDYSVSSLSQEFSTRRFDIEVDSTNRRIYILQHNSQNLLILDLDDGTEIANTYEINGYSMVLDEANQLIYTLSSGSSASAVFKYSVQDDIVTEVERNTAGGTDARGFSISPDGTTLCFTSDNYPSPDSMIVYNSEDLSSPLHELEYGSGQSEIYYNPQEELVYLVEGTYDNLHILKASDFSEIRAIPYFSSRDSTLFTTNRLGTVGVGCSNNSTTGEFEFTFFRNIGE